MSNPNNNELDKIFEDKFYCSTRFSNEIEMMVVNNKGLKYIDAIVMFCEENNLDVESIPKLVSKPLKEKLKAEAIEFNMLKRTSHAKLPI
jgi:hypothetical protein